MGCGSQPPSCSAEPVTSPGGCMGPSDVHLFGPLKKHPVRMQFATDADIKQAVISCLDT